MLDEVRRKLEKLEGGAKWLDENSEESDGYNLLGDTISTTFLVLLELCVEILSTMRKKPLGKF